MSLVRRRRGTSVPVGRLHVLLGGDLRTYVRWSPSDEDAEFGRVAVVACVDWAVRSTLTDQGWSRRAVAGLLERACRSVSVGDYNVRCGTTEVVHAAPPPGTLGPSTQVTVHRREDGLFGLDWSVPPRRRTISDAERLLAALWAVAAEEGHAEAVHHALFTLRGGFDASGGFAPRIADDLVTSLVNFGVEMAATDARAAESRSQWRVVGGRA